MLMEKKKKIFVSEPWSPQRNREKCVRVKVVYFKAELRNDFYLYTSLIWGKRDKCGYWIVQQNITHRLDMWKLLLLVIAIEVKSYSSHNKAQWKWECFSVRFLWNVHEKSRGKVFPFLWTGVLQCNLLQTPDSKLKYKIWK